MMNNVLEFMQRPMFLMGVVLFLFTAHALYMKRLFNHFRLWVHLDMLDYIRNNEKPQEQEIEQEFNNRFRVLRNASFAPKMSRGPYIKLVPTQEKDQDS